MTDSWRWSKIVGRFLSDPTTKTTDPISSYCSANFRGFKRARKNFFSLSLDPRSFWWGLASLGGLSCQRRRPFLPTLFVPQSQREQRRREEERRSYQNFCIFSEKCIPARAKPRPALFYPDTLYQKAFLWTLTLAGEGMENINQVKFRKFPMPAWYISAMLVF